MPIARSAITRWLNRKLDNHDWVKKLPAKTIDKELATLDPYPDFHTTPRLNQKAAFILGLDYNRFNFHMDMGCVDGNTEYLSPEGWVKISEYKGGQVAQYDPYTRQAKFVSPGGYLVKPCENMYHFKTDRGCDQMLSSGHKVLAIGGWTGNRNYLSRMLEWKQKPICALDEYKTEGYSDTPHFFETTPEEIAGVRHCRFETTFLMSNTGIDLTDEQLRIQVAVHADGYLSGNRVYINIKKERKKERLRLLLKKADIEYKEKPGSDIGYTCFDFVPPQMSKTYGTDWYQATSEQKTIITEEVVNWDGSGGTLLTGAQFYTRSKSCADFIQFCFASTRWRASINTSVRNDGHHTGQIDYVVHAISQTGRSSNLAYYLNYEIVPAPNNKMYCFNVPSGYLVFRRNNYIFISGNTGKSKLILDLIRYEIQCGRPVRALIFVPYLVAIENWLDEIQTHAPDLTYSLGYGSSDERWQELRRRVDVTILTYAGFVAMVRGHLIDPDTNKKSGWFVDNELVDKIACKFNFVCFDESTALQHRTSLTAQACNRLIKTAGPTCLGYNLTGTPVGRDPVGLWHQFYVLDRGETLGKNITFFREVFYDIKPGKWAMYDYTLKKGMLPKIHQIIKHRSIAWDADECVDLPKRKDIIQKLKFTNSVEKYYQNILEAIRSTARDPNKIRSRDNNWHHLRQLCSGWCGVHDDETHTRIDIEFRDNPKLEHFMGIVHSLPIGHSMLVFYEYIPTGNMLAKRLKKEKIKFAQLSGQTKDSIKELRKFKDDPAITIFLINNDSGAFALNLQKANYTYFFEMPSSPIVHKQARRRTRRGGSKYKKCFYYYPLIVGSADIRVKQYLDEGKNVHDVVVAGRLDFEGDWIGTKKRRGRRK